MFILQKSFFENYEAHSLIPMSALNEETFAHMQYFWTFIANRVHAFSFVKASSRSPLFEHKPSLLLI
jgi:hypothetical protein